MLTSMLFGALAAARALAADRVARLRSLMRRRLGWMR
jgi:hypothetical protein